MKGSDPIYTQQTRQPIPAYVEKKDEKVTLPFDLDMQYTIYKNGNGLLIPEHLTSAPHISALQKNLSKKNSIDNVVAFTLKPHPIESVTDEDVYDGRIIIFDKVDTVILPESPMVSDSKTRQLHFYWDSKDLKSRNVAWGSYVAIAYINFYFDNKKYASQVKQTNFELNP